MSMKKIWVFILGVITGAVLLILVSLFISKTTNNDVTMFAEAGECISENPFKVFQVLEPGVALANELSADLLDNEMFYGMTVLFISEEKHYYDDEIIRVPKGKCVKQIGTYKYSNKAGQNKTVPVVEILNK